MMYKSMNIPEDDSPKSTKPNARVRPQIEATASVIQDQARILENFNRSYYVDKDKKLRDKNTGRVVK